MLYDYARMQKCQYKWLLSNNIVALDYFKTECWLFFVFKIIDELFDWFNKYFKKLVEIKSSNLCLMIHLRFYQQNEENRFS